MPTTARAVTEKVGNEAVAIEGAAIVANGRVSFDADPVSVAAQRNAVADQAGQTKPAEIRGTRNRIRSSEFDILIDAAVGARGADIKTAPSVGIVAGVR